jgi:hypothetical protein
MPTLDLIGAIELTGGAAIVVGTLVVAYPGGPETRVRIALAFGAWFAALVTLAALGVFQPGVGLGTLALGAVVVLSIVVMTATVLSSPERRLAFASIPLAVLIGVHFLRVLGGNFVLLYADGRLPAPFGPTAGWGDVFIGITALPVAWLVAKRIPGWRPVALIWSFLGALDLVTAIILGVSATPDSPIPLFTGPIDTSLLTILPWIIIPGFLVPTFLSLHVAVLTRLLRADARSRGRLPEATAA